MRTPAKYLLVLHTISPVTQFWIGKFCAKISAAYHSLYIRISDVYLRYVLRHNQFMDLLNQTNCGQTSSFERNFYHSILYHEWIEIPFQEICLPCPGNICKPGHI